MKKPLLIALAVCLLTAFGSSVWAVVGQPVMGPGGVVIDTKTEIKTPPLKTSDTFHVPVELHNTFPITNWAGYRVKFHILDGTEVSVTPGSILYGIGPAGPLPGPLVSPNFPQSTVAQSLTVFRTVWDPSAPNSGRLLPASAWFSLVDLQLHAKNTNIGQNSDVDMTVMAWNIRHLRPGPASSQFQHSALVWATSNFHPTPENPIPSLGPQIDGSNAHWVHIPFDWHVPQGIGSQYVATLAGTAFIGLEHVPEPIAGILALTGGGMLLGSWLLRQWRLARDRAATIA